MSTSTAKAGARREALAAIYRVVPRSVWFTVLVVWASAYVLWPVADAVPLLAWAVVVTSINIARFVHALERMNSLDFLDHPEREERALVWGLGAAGGGLALGFLLFGLRAPLAEQYVLTLFVLGLCAGSVTVLTGCRRAFLAYNSPMVIGIAACTLWLGFVEGDGLRGFLGLMMSLYAVAMFLFQKQLDRTFLENIRLRHEQTKLLAEKDALLAELRDHNKELSEDRDQFLAASLTDGLTGLANRRHFDRTLYRDWERSRREHAPLACVMVDIDHFKHYNDRYGHMAGDDCLRSIARIIDTTVSRGGDFAARYGGEEFVVLLPGTDDKGGRMLAERIREAVERQAIPHAGGGPERVVTLSAGVSAVTGQVGDASAQTLVDLADEALYEAKRAGRNRVKVRTSTELRVPPPGRLASGVSF